MSEQGKNANKGVTMTSFIFKVRLGEDDADSPKK
jgi:hypothetical protein